MNHINQNKTTSKNQIAEVKSELDKVLDRAKQELKDLLVQAQKLARQVQQQDKKSK